MSVIDSDLELWRNPNFPSLEILENQTRTVLEAFNKSRKLDIRFKGDDNEIKKLHLLFNSLTERRASESSKLSMYSEDVVIYMRSLLEGNANIKVVLETLSSLLTKAKNRQKDTTELMRDYKEFLKQFNREIYGNEFRTEIIKPILVFVLGFILAIFQFYEKNKSENKNNSYIEPIEPEFLQYDESLRDTSSQEALVPMTLPDCKDLIEVYKPVRIHLKTPLHEDETLSFEKCLFPTFTDWGDWDSPYQHYQYTQYTTYFVTIFSISCIFISLMWILILWQPKLRNMLYKTSQNQRIEKDDKILEIGERIPIIIQNTEILNQFWDNQIININAYIESINSFNEGVIIRIPKQPIWQIKEIWNEQFEESKKNFIRMKDLVTHNSLLTIDKIKISRDLE